jgi:ribonuclease PH
MLQEIAATSVGIVTGRPMLDLAYVEDSTAEVDFNVVMTGAGEFVEVQGTAERGAFSRAMTDRLLDLASAGVASLVELQRAAVTSARGS